MTLLSGQRTLKDPTGGNGTFAASKDGADTAEIQWTSVGEGVTWQIVKVAAGQFALQLHAESGTMSLQGPVDNAVNPGTPQQYLELIGPRPFLHLYGTETGGTAWSLNSRDGKFQITNGNPGQGAIPAFEINPGALHADFYDSLVLRMFSDGGVTQKISIDGSNGDIITQGSLYDHSGSGGATAQFPTATDLIAARGASQWLGTASAALNTAGTGWVDLGANDISLSGVKAGDWIEVGVSGRWTNASTEAFMDVASIVSAAPVNYWSGSNSATTQGVQAWKAENYSAYVVMGGSVLRQVVAGDLSAGVLTLRLRARSASATDRACFNTTDIPFHFWAKNLGQ